MLNDDEAHSAGRPVGPVLQRIFMTPSLGRLRSSAGFASKIRSSAVAAKAGCVPCGKPFLVGLFHRLKIGLEGKAVGRRSQLVPRSGIAKF